MIPLTNEENESYLKQEVCHICKKVFITDIDDSICLCNKNIIIQNKIQYKI